MLIIELLIIINMLHIQFAHYRTSSDKKLNIFLLLRNLLRKCFFLNVKNFGVLLKCLKAESFTLPRQFPCYSLVLNRFNNISKLTCPLVRSDNSLNSNYRQSSSLPIFKRSIDNVCLQLRGVLRLSAKQQFAQHHKGA